MEHNMVDNISKLFCYNITLKNKKHWKIKKEKILKKIIKIQLFAPNGLYGNEFFYFLQYL